MNVDNPRYIAILIQKTTAKVAREKVKCDCAPE